MGRTEELETENLPEETKPTEPAPKKEPTRYLRYKDPGGTETIAPIDSADIEQRKRVLGNHGCTDFAVLDENKKPL